jgi:ribosomal protein S18 acetylase RimI-like enzyme
VNAIDAQAHENLGGFLRFLGELDAGAQMLDEPGVLALRGATDFPSARVAIRHGELLAADAFAHRVCDFLLRDGKTACVFVRADVDTELYQELINRGFIEYARSPEMVCEDRLEDRTPPPGVDVRLAESADDVRAYAEIAGHAFRHLSIPESITCEAIDNAGVMLGSKVAVALADLDGRPVAGACSILVGDAPNGYVGWVACLDDARGRGLGDVVTRRVTNEAFDRGASIVTLEASHFGESTYARMGYRELYRYVTLIKV